jgi:hypothetical protein
MVCLEFLHSITALAYANDLRPELLENNSVPFSLGTPMKPRGIPAQRDMTP